MKYIDCLGDMCPIPILKIKNILKYSNKGDEITLTTDHSCVVQEVTDYFKRKKHIVIIDEVMNGVWEIHITVV